MRERFNMYSPTASRVIRVPKGCDVHQDRVYMRTIRKRAVTVPANIYPQSAAHVSFHRAVAIASWFGQGGCVKTASLEDVVVLPQVHFRFLREAGELK